LFDLIAAAHYKGTRFQFNPNFYGENFSRRTDWPPLHGQGAFECLAAGASAVMPKMAIPGIGWQAYLLDSEKNIFGLHQTDADAK